MIKKLPAWVLVNKFPAFYDTESLTAIEQTARVYGKMNELVDSYNTFAENVTNIINEFIADSESEYETFKIAIRQEYQDFIDVINLKVIEQDAKIENAEDYMKNNIVNITSNLVNEALNNQTIQADLSYDQTTESLNFIFEGSL